MKTSANGRKLIEGFEGLILKAYDDHNDKVVEPGQTPIGTLTIGYGHTGPDVHIGMVITKDQADQLLSQDLSGAEKDVARYVKVPLNQNQYDALVSFQFNTGWLGHEHCSLLSALNAGNYNLADQDFMLYDRAQGVVLAGLDRRRTAEKALFNTPVAAVNTKAINTTSVVVAAGTAGAAVAQHPAVQHSPILFLGFIFAAVIIGGLVHWYLNRKAT